MELNNKRQPTEHKIKFIESLIKDKPMTDEIFKMKDKLKWADTLYKNTNAPGSLYERAKLIHAIAGTLEVRAKYLDETVGDYAGAARLYKWASRVRELEEPAWDSCSEGARAVTASITMEDDIVKAKKLYAKAKNEAE
ncbi:MAG: hypothetical protein AB1468_04600 [Candidatus Micrarchaeota archaeon]